MKPLVCALLLLIGHAAVADSGTVIRNSDLREKPFSDSRSIATLSSNSKIEIQKNQGAWMQVKTPQGQVGWIKLLNVRTQSGTRNNGLSTLGNVIKTGSSGQTVTTGVKGLSAEQIQTAEPNMAEVNKMESYSSSNAEASRLARQAQLSPKKVAPLSNSNTSVNTPNTGRRP
ncbi:SH3 domain-containing protein [Deefgea salmonis]|uniref:SH3 domain-containing protein n=1 Tax=Deefgea salmonis TaxID=2875502 RepID=A0ABS8BJ34_9NEIS|nr:SH3 domain-containing protein [Deefgea salmonis]MCB5195546.1 SH3 domain-containing protein [Deefgea salmonis]